jgi:hypothetical protein
MNIRKLKLFQSNRETLLWTFEELKTIENDNTFEILKSDEYSFKLNDIEFIVNKKLEEYINKNQLQNIEYIKDGVNVIVFERFYTIEDVKKIINNNDEYKFIFINKTIEGHWLVAQHEIKELFDLIESKNNIKVIWDVANSNFKNFYFEPKLHIQNYYNSPFAFPYGLFLYGNDLFKLTPNKKRVGIHFNKVHTKHRKGIYDYYIDNLNDNLFFTVNKECLINDEQNIITNYRSPIFEPNLQLHGLSYHVYVDGFLNLNIKSEMELVYETSTTTAETKEEIKWSEKTIKHLFLGKPFIHMDPVAHKLMEINGFKSYVSLYTNELLDLYNNVDMNVLLKNEEYYWYDLLIKNIDWLINMKENEWKFRIDEANKIAKENRQRVVDLIFNTSLLKYVIV